MRDLLFEIGMEELPSASVSLLGNALSMELACSLGKAGVAFSKLRYLATPRRLAVTVDEVPETVNTQKVSRRGPAYDGSVSSSGEFNQAVKGFAKSCGVSCEELQVQETDKGKWWFYESQSSVKPTIELLPQIIMETIKALPIKKAMRWGEGEYEFVRPVHWAILLYGEEVVSCSVLGVNTDNKSYGHRFLFPDTIVIDKPSKYETLLQDAFVIADFAMRRQLIEEQSQYLATTVGGVAVYTPELLDEVTSIVEWPLALLAQFDESFLEVPQEALIASMQSHQKCFPLRTANGELMPYFITVSNIKSKDPERVILGNEKVMRARLSDAAFFYKHDLKMPLSQYREMTKNVVFQEKLGTLYDKSERLCQGMAYLATVLKLNEKEAMRAAQLSKCCLMTGMVGEFPELQGIMGRYYAKAEGENEAVALAVSEQYLPHSGTDNLPESNLGLALSLMDRLDTLVGIFAIGLRPSGVKDPFKLRRHALAVVRILLKLADAPSLSTLLKQAFLAYGNMLKVDDQCLNSLHEFIFERVYAYYEGQGIPNDFINAARALQNENFNDLEKRIVALRTFSELKDAASLSAACKRVNNILQTRDRPGLHNEEVNTSLLKESAEKELYSQLQNVEKELRQYYASQDYPLILAQLAQLRTSVDNFFEHVMVMVDDKALQQNRILLLVQLQKMLQGVADISKLELVQKS